MRWGLAACCAFAVGGWNADVGVIGRREAIARADAKASAKVEAIAIADTRRAPDEAPEAEAAIEEPDGAIEEVPVDGDLPVYVVRGREGLASSRIVFLTGSCTTPLTYVRAFARAAAEHGGLVALQGDTACRDGSRRWSPDSVATSARIDAALRAAGVEDLDDLTVIGYSQGAERAEWLAHRFPAKYTRFVLMAGPIVPSASRFSNALAVATLAGYGDVRENMADGAKRLRRSSIPAIYMELPGIHHGELALSADAVVARALEWVASNARTPAGNPPSHNRGARAKHTRPR